MRARAWERVSEDKGESMGEGEDKGIGEGMGAGGWERARVSLWARVRAGA